MDFTPLTQVRAGSRADRGLPTTTRWSSSRGCTRPARPPPPATCEHPRVEIQADVGVDTYVLGMECTDTEWSLQKRLTNHWLQDDLVILDGEPLFLAAWEVMTSYKVNDARRHWNEPSVDFVFLDAAGRMVMVELKRDVRTPLDAWSVICQVTHRAHVLASGFSTSRLEGVYFDCHSGADGRKSNPTPVGRLLEGHARAFAQPALESLPGVPARRMIMACSFGPTFSEILQLANTAPREQMIALVSHYKPRGEIKRFLELVHDPSFLDPRPIRAVTINGSTYPQPLGAD